MKKYFLVGMLTLATINLWAQKNSIEKEHKFHLPITETYTCPTISLAETSDFNYTNAKRSGKTEFSNSDSSFNSSEFFLSGVPIVLSFACGVNGNPLPNGFTEAESLTCCLSLQLHAGQNSNGGFVGYNSSVFYKKVLTPGKKCKASGNQFLCYQ